MTTHSDIVRTAREYLETPWHHQARVKGVGIDCAGLIVCVANELGLYVSDRQGYSHQPHREFVNAVEESLDRIDRPIFGGIAVFAFEAEPTHIGIISSLEPLMVIHTWAQMRKCVENNIDETWQKRLRGFYTYRGVSHG